MKCSIDGVVFGELCLQPLEAVCRGSLAFDMEPFLQGYTIEGGLHILFVVLTNPQILGNVALRGQSILKGYIETAT